MSSEKLTYMYIHIFKYIHIWDPKTWVPEKENVSVPVGERAVSQSLSQSVKKGWHLYYYSVALFDILLLLKFRKCWSSDIRQVWGTVYLVSGSGSPITAEIFFFFGINLDNYIAITRQLSHSLLTWSRKISQASLASEKIQFFLNTL